MYQIISQNDKSYHGDKTRINASSLKSIINGGDYALDFEKTFSGVELGNAIHKFCETGNSNTILQLPVDIGKTYAGKKAQEFIAQNNGNNIILDVKDYDKYLSIIKYFNTRNDKNTKEVKSYVNNPKALKEAVIHFDIEGIPAKGKIDWLLIDENNKKITIIDHKTDNSDNPSLFEYSYNNKMYWFSMIFYAIPFVQEGYEVELGINVFQNKEPFNIYYYPIDFLEHYEEVYSLIVAYAIVWQNATQKNKHIGHGRVGQLKLNYNSINKVKGLLKSVMEF